MKTQRNLRSFWTTLLVMLFVCNGLTWSNNQESSRKKEYNQSFAVSPGNNLLLDNKYGNITVTHWKKDEVAIRVVVEVKTRNEKQAQETLNRIRVDLKKEKKTIMGYTEIRSASGNSEVNFSINYYINMPSWLDMNIEQKYGNISLPETNKGLCNILIKYGNIKAGDFTQPLTLSAKYSNITIGKLKDGNLEIGYSDNMKIGEAEQINITSGYSNLEIGKIGTLNLIQKYGQISIESANTVNADIKYSTFKINYLERNLLCDRLAYSNLDITKADSKFLLVYVKSHYGNVYVGLPENSSFKVEAEDIEYGDCDLSRRFKKTHTEKHDDSTYYEINNGRNGTIKFDGGSYGKLTVSTSD